MILFKNLYLLWSLFHNIKFFLTINSLLNIRSLTCPRAISTIIRGTNNSFDCNQRKWDEAKFNDERMKALLEFVWNHFGEMQKKCSNLKIARFRLPIWPSNIEGIRRFVKVDEGSRWNTTEDKSTAQQDIPPRAQKEISWQVENHFEETDNLIWNFTHFWG